MPWRREILGGGGARNLEADGELPSTGLLGMKFMQQARRDGIVTC